MSGAKGPNTKKEQTDGIIKEWEEGVQHDKMLMKNSRCKEGKDYQKSSTLHHMVLSCSKDEGNILR
jgi:hypothetical protein